jgi:hypothetical protein
MRNTLYVISCIVLLSSCKTKENNVTLEVNHEIDVNKQLLIISLKNITEIPQQHYMVKFMLNAEILVKLGGHSYVFHEVVFDHALKTASFIFPKEYLGPNKVLIWKIPFKNLIPSCHDKRFDDVKEGEVYISKLGDFGLQVDHDDN